MKFQLSGAFGELSPVRNMKPHNGIDLAIPEGTTLRSISDGVVDKVFDGSGPIGKGLSIKLADGSRAIYGHMSQVKAKIGEHIQSGEIIGLSGNTGNSTGPHLHFGLKAADGHWMDPTPLADKLANAAGNINWINGPLTQFGGWISEKVSEVTINRVVDYFSDFALAFPVIAIVSGTVYVLINMVSKGAAKWGAIATMIYGLFAIR